jgi:membrane-bound lytic murein transglycosylase A
MPVLRCGGFHHIAAATLWLFAATAAACAGDFPQASVPDVDPLDASDTQLEPMAWSAVEGWDKDDQAAAFKAFMTSCRPFLVRKRAPHNSRDIYNALWHVCRRAKAAGHLGVDKNKARAFFEKNFVPVRIARLGESTGLLTGYYEPVVEGSRFPNPEFHTPVYRRPRDLVVPGHSKAKSKAKTSGRPKSTLPNTGAVSRLNTNKKLEPYYDRAAIEDGALDGRKLEICWIKSPFDLLAIQIQGSARVRLEDDTMLRIGYDAHNGYPYSSVGRVLIDRKLVPRDQMSMARIRDWMQAHPEEARDVRQTNKSYVFFRITGLSNDGQPNGAQGVPLTPERSIAVDKMHVYGTPFFIEAELPIESARAKTKFHRLMIAQDTGSAITGPARADIYWGSGKEAATIAGRIRQQGRFVMLLPRELDMVEAGKAMPLPPPKPVIPAPEAKTKKKGGTSAKDANAATAVKPAATTASPRKSKTSDDKKEAVDKPASTPIPPSKPRSKGTPAPRPKAKPKPRRES